MLRPLKTKKRHKTKLRVTDTVFCLCLNMLLLEMEFTKIRIQYTLLWLCFCCLLICTVILNLHEQWGSSWRNVSNETIHCTDYTKCDDESALNWQIQQRRIVRAGTANSPVFLIFYESPSHFASFHMLNWRKPANFKDLMLLCVLWAFSLKCTFPTQLLLLVIPWS